MRMGWLVTYELEAKVYAKVTTWPRVEKKERYVKYM